MIAELERDSDYFKWREAAWDSGLLADASLEFYRDRGTGRVAPYTVTINGTEMIYPLLTTKEWENVDSNLDNVITVEDRNVVKVSSTRDTLEEFAEYFAYRDGDDPDKAEMTDYVWDGDVYMATKRKVDSPEYTITTVGYFDYIESLYPFISELSEVLYVNDVNPQDYSQVELQHILSKYSLPYREEVAGTPQKLVSNSRLVTLIGGSTSFLLKTPECWKLLLIRRSEDASVSPNKIGGIGGIFDPMSESITDQLFREVVEELFSGTEGVSPESHPMGRKLLDWYQDEQLDLHYTRTLVDTLIGDTHLRFTTVIDTPELSQEFISQLEPNDEVQSTVLVDLPDEFERIEALLKESNTSSNTIPVIADAVELAGANYDADVGGNITTGK